MNMHSSALAIAHDVDVKESAFAGDVLAGLRHNPKYLSPKYFYDTVGSELFEQITQLPEYYPTRTELGILRDRSAEIASIIPHGAALIEFGAGATTKARLLLNECDLAAYVPVDISEGFLNEQAQALQCDYPELGIYPVVADFTAPFKLPNDIQKMPKVGFFPGSTLGNFEPEEACEFLRRARQILGQEAHLIIGIDLEKNERILHAAYNDPANVTARFNLNLLARINRELGGNFNLSGFIHQAIYNRKRHRIEMHLVSRTTQTVHLLGCNIFFHTGETIHTENSYKYSIEHFSMLVHDSGWTAKQSWIDAQNLFSVHVLIAE